MSIVVSILFGYKTDGDIRSSHIEALNGLKTNIKPEIKKWIDELYSYKIIDIKHTTKESIPAGIRIIPDKPRPFEAGRYKVTFTKGILKKSVICQTEEVVGHYVKVIPGETKVRGYVQILDNPLDDFGPGTKLNPEELDYFIKAIYNLFSRPLGNDEVNHLNKIKDYALAIMFSDRKGIDDYHNKLLLQLKSH